MAATYRHGAWSHPLGQALQQPPRVDITTSKWGLPSADVLLQQGAYVSTGMDSTAQRHIRLPLPSGAGLHIKEYAHEYRIHWDEVDPEKDLLGHLAKDAPGILLVGLILAALIWGG